MPSEDEAASTASSPRAKSPTRRVHHHAVKLRWYQKLSYSPRAYSSLGMVLLVLTILTRLWRIEHPGQVVFDEVHFGKFAAYYLQRTYFFDVHPPLAKMLFALAGWFVGFDGKFLFDNIGDDYVANNVPYIGLRLFSAAFGIAIVPLAFTIMRDIGLSAPTAFMGGLMLVLDNALVTQSQLILLDTQLLFFGMLSAYCYVQFFKHRSVPLTRVWWTWNLATGASLACVLGVKLVGFITVATVGMAVAFDLWRLLDIRRGLTVREFTRHFAARALGLIFFPIAIYMLFFVAHFQILRYSGPGDDFMSLPFQSTLEGNKITTASTRVPFPSVVTLHARTHDVFLHSHLDRYPLRYDDGRVSSAGQQVSGYPHVDVNNLWSLDEPDPARVPVPHREPTAIEKAAGLRYLMNNDLVRLRHVNTSSYLLTHDVASPLTPTNMEMTTVLEDVANQRYNETVWRVVFDGKDGDNLMIRSKRHSIKFVNLHHNVAIHAHAGTYGDWGFKQTEINGNKAITDTRNAWTIRDIQHPRIVNGIEINEAGDPLEPDDANPKVENISFMQKFLEIHTLMFHHNAALTKPHPYSSEAITWPFVLRGISYWETKVGLKQIYLLGNPFIWWSAISGVLVWIALTLVDLLLLRRGVDELGANMRTWWYRGPGFLVLYWAGHWVPFFLMGRKLFLHHYLPSVMFSIMVTVSVLECAGKLMSPTMRPALLRRMNLAQWKEQPVHSGYYAVLVGLAALYAITFFYFSPLTYGTGFPTVEHIRRHKWLSSWDLQHA